MNFFNRKIVFGLFSLTIFSSVCFAQNSHEQMHKQEFARTVRYVQRIANQEGSFASSAKLDFLLRNVLIAHDILLGLKRTDSIEALMALRNQHCNDIKNIYHDNEHERGVNAHLVDLVKDVLMSYCGFSALTLDVKPVNILILPHDGSY